MNFRVVLTRFERAIILAILIGLFFTVMARVDYIVNFILYGYGLVFSHNWANQYWIAYNASFLVFSAMIGFIYWFGSRKALCDKKVVAALVLTINLLALGGLQDVLYFTVWAGGLPANNVVWWWSEWVSLGIVGTWNSAMQIALASAVSAVSLLAWALALRQKNKTCDYPL